MIDSNLTIGDLIEAPEVQTVIRLEQGRTEPDKIAESFVFTKEVTSHFNVIMESILSKKPQGYFLKGDFGSGKSHFLACLYAALEQKEKLRGLSESHGGIKRFFASGEKLLPVDVSLVRYRGSTPIERIIIQSIERALSDKGISARLSPLSQFIDWFKLLLSDKKYSDSFLSDSGIDSTDIFKWIDEHPEDSYRAGLLFIKKNGITHPELLIEERHATFRRVFEVIKKSGYNGLLLLIDELSEFMRSKPGSQGLNEDARTLQYMGELTASDPIWIIAAVQESIEKTGDIALAILRKIKDRFPVTLSLSTLHIQSLISERLVRLKPGAEEKIFAIYEEYKKQFSSFSISYPEFKSVYPVHPKTIRFLDGLGELFSVHRGIVDFIHSRIQGDPSRNIEGILTRPAMELLSPDSIFDHFENRLAEFSSFFVYPRHIIPHLKEIIESAIEGQKDRDLAVRLVKILVLCKIHPAKEEPNAKELAELTGSALFLEDPRMNARFIMSGILEPLAESSRFIVRRKSKTEDPLDAVYAVVSEESPDRLLKQRVAAKKEELKDDDSRLLLIPISELAESFSWPGPLTLEMGIVWKIEWLQSTRTAFVRFIFDAGKKELDEFYYDFSVSKSDFGLVLTPSLEHAELDHTAFWHFPYHEADKKPLKEYVAMRLVTESLSPENPIDGEIITEAREKCASMQQFVQKWLFDLIYSGFFSGNQIKTHPAISQMRRFDRILEAAGEVLLSKRYPEYRRIAPVRVPPSPRFYQRILEEVVKPGSFSIREAKANGLSDAIEGLALPLGLVEIKGGTYQFSSSIAESPLLASFFALLKASSVTPIEKVKEALSNGVYGVPPAMFAFIVSALACSGLISLIRGKRQVPASAITLTAVENAEAIAPGELISQSDRDTLVNECSFLLPGPNGLDADSFGLALQREVWKTLLKFKESVFVLASSVSQIEERFSEFHAFMSFDLKKIKKHSEALSLLADQIKVSYQAKEGIERFLSAWRGSGVIADDIEVLKKFVRFAKTLSDRFIFIHHYINHPEVDKVCGQDSECARLRNPIVELFKKPEALIIEEESRELLAIFDRFRESYTSLYKKSHDEYYESFVRRPLSKYAARALNTIEALSKIESLDRPEGLSLLLEGLYGKSSRECRRRVIEELCSSPLCSCNYRLGDPPSSGAGDPEESIERILYSYIGILSEPRLCESIYAWAFAIREKDMQMHLRLTELCKVLAEKKVTPSSLLDLTGPETIEHIGRALLGKLIIEKRDPQSLAMQLTGRRLMAQEVEEILLEWLGTETKDERTLFSFESEKAASARESHPLRFFWPAFHRDIFSAGYAKEPYASGEGKIEEELARLYPASAMKKRFEELSTPRLIRFGLEEPLHYNAIMLAWQIIVTRVLQGEKWPEGAEIESLYYSRPLSSQIERSFLIPAKISALRELAFPEQLCLRLKIDDIASSPHASEELISSAFSFLEKWEADCTAWMETLPPVPVIDLADNPVVLICDGVSADVWLSATSGAGIVTGADAYSWHRLPGIPYTVDAISALFGFEGDPIDEFHKRDIQYHSLKGNEERSILDHISPLPESSIVIRLGIIDIAGHEGRRICEIAALLKSVLDKQILELRQTVKDKKRRLILTVDHGFTLKKSGLSHGKGGVFERIIPYIECGRHYG